MIRRSGCCRIIQLNLTLNYFRCPVSQRVKQRLRLATHVHKFVQHVIAMLVVFLYQIQLLVTLGRGVETSPCRNSIPNKFLYLSFCNKQFHAFSKENYLFLYNTSGMNHSKKAGIRTMSEKIRPQI